MVQVEVKGKQVFNLLLKSSLNSYQDQLKNSKIRESYG